MNTPLVTETRLSDERPNLEGLSLYAITLDGTMRGSYWGSMLGDDTADVDIPFEMDFLLPKEGERPSPFAHYWEDIREALIAATSSGDLIGQCGEVEAVWIVFRYAGQGHTAHVMRELKPGRATRDLFLVN